MRALGKQSCQSTAVNPERSFSEPQQTESLIRRPNPNEPNDRSHFEHREWGGGREEDIDRERERAGELLLLRL